MIPTFHSGQRDSLCGVQVASPPVFTSELGPHPHIALSIFQQVQNILRIRIKIVQIYRNNFLSSKFDIDWTSRRSAVVHELLALDQWRVATEYAQAFCCARKTQPGYHDSNRPSDTHRSDDTTICLCLYDLVLEHATLVTSPNMSASESLVYPKLPIVWLIRTERFISHWDV